MQQEQKLRWKLITLKQKDFPRFNFETTKRLELNYHTREYVFLTFFFGWI